MDAEKINGNPAENVVENTAENVVENTAASVAEVSISPYAGGSDIDVGMDNCRFNHSNHCINDSSMVGRSYFSNDRYH